MKKIILSFVCALVIFSACQKSDLEGPDGDFVTPNSSDTTLIKPPIVTPVGPGLSFANDVVPVLTMCNKCHIHGWTTSSITPTFYANLVNKGYVKPIYYTSSIIYATINGGHPGASNISKNNTDKIINWMKEGSKNN